MFYYFLTKQDIAHTDMMYMLSFTVMFIGTLYLGFLHRANSIIQSIINILFTLYIIYLYLYPNKYIINIYENAYGKFNMYYSSIAVVYVTLYIWALIGGSKCKENK